MKPKTFLELLLGNDLRRLRGSDRVVAAVYDQTSFDELFALLFHHERPLVMRAADAVEKVTLRNPEYLESHKSQLLALLKSAGHKELKWHLAQLVSRLALNGEELISVWHVLSYWARNVNENKIVRVNSLEALCDLSEKHTTLRVEFMAIMASLEHEQAPSLQARIRKLRKGLPST